MFKLLIGAALVVVVAGFAMRATKVYKFKCLKSNQIYEFSTGAAPKCPAHNEYHLVKVH